MLNSAENKTTKKTPFSALHDYQPRFHQGVLGSLSQNNNEWKEPTEVQNEVSSNILEGQRAMFNAYNRKHIPGVNLDLGEIVVMQRAPALGQPSKLQSKYRDNPLQVIQKLNGDTYRVVEVAPEGQSTWGLPICAKKNGFVFGTAHLRQKKKGMFFRQPICAKFTWYNYNYFFSNNNQLNNN